MTPIANCVNPVLVKRLYKGANMKKIEFQDEWIRLIYDRSVQDNSHFRKGVHDCHQFLDEMDKFIDKWFPNDNVQHAEPKPKECTD
jgi:hypothetical protein